MADNITTAVQSEVATLAHKHVHVTYAVLSVLVLVIVLMGFGGYLALRSFDKQLAQQQARDAQYQQDRTLWQAQVAQHDTERAQQASQISQLQAQISKRDSQPLPKEVQAGLQPDATADTVAKAVTEAYSKNPAFGQATATPGGQVSLSVPQAQATVEAKVGFDKSSADLADEKSMVSLLNGSNSSLTNDLNQCKLLNVQAGKDIEGFKRLAKRSRWQKFMGGVEKVALVAVGFELGHKL